MTSERTADADAAIVHLGLGLPGRSYRKITKDDAIAALDRLVARNQQLQEALTPFAQYDFAAAQWLDGHELRALWAEDVEALKDYAAAARAALASVRARTPE